MRLFRPRSIFQLTVFGFLTVAAPLLAALIITVRQLDALGHESQRAVFDAAHAMRASRVLVEQTLAMERNARQYAVLGDRSLLEVHADRRRDFLHAADVLRRLPMGGDIEAYATRLIESERHAFAALHASADGNGEADAALAAYPALLDLANGAALSINDWIDQKLLDLRARVASTQQLIFIEALLLAAAALLMAALFTALITRPLRQIDRAIHQLGDGSLPSPVSVEGPRDMEELGERLEWLRNRLRDLEAQRVAFLRHVSHELKTPLTAIQEGVALLNERLVGPLTEQQGEITGILRNQCRRLQRLIDELLRFNFSRLAAAADDRPVRLDAVIERVISDHALALQAGKVQVAERLDVATVRGDPDRFRVIVDNLLTNAIKFSPPEATVTVALVCTGDRVVLEVGDEGPGIPREERSLVFEPYYQGRPPDKKRFRGTGLGLAITQNYVRLSGGTIEILDAARGALFRVQFPLTGAAA